MNTAAAVHLLRATGPGPPSRRVHSSALLQAALQVQARLTSPLLALANASRAALLLLATATTTTTTTTTTVALWASLAWLVLEPARLACGYSGNLRESAELAAGAALLSALSGAAAATLLGRAARHAARLPSAASPSPSSPSWSVHRAALAVHGVDAASSAGALAAAAATVALSVRAAIPFSRRRRRVLLWAAMALRQAAAASSSGQGARD